MPTRPNPADPSATTPFSGLGAGLDFFQDWMKAASSALPQMGTAAGAGTGAWGMPTLDPEELDKRIQELKTVQFWLEQNARMIGMTIQTLEVQRMTLQTLRGMNVPTDVLRESLKVVQPAADAPKAAPQSTPEPAAESESKPDASGTAPAVDPMAWWNTLAQQFTQMTTQAVQAGQEAVNTMQSATATAQAAASTQAKPAAEAAKAARKRTSTSGKGAAAKSTQQTKSGTADGGSDATPPARKTSTRSPRR